MSLFTRCGANIERLAVTISPTPLKTLSAAALIAGNDKTFRAKAAIHGR